MSLYCGIDIGTQGSKVGLYRSDGTCAGQAYAEHTFDNLAPGWIEMDPDQIVGAVTGAMAEAASAAGTERAGICSIAMSGILCGPVFIDDDWRPVRPIIPFLDVRATDEVAWLANEVEPRWVTESANAALDTYVMPAVYEWVRRNEPERAARIAKIVSLAPYVGGCLAGLRAAEAYTDPTHLSGWIIGWDAATGRVSERQMQDLGIDMSLIPTVRPSADVVGALTADMAERTGFPIGVPICAGAGDVMQSNLGAGLTSPGLASDVAGTASILSVGVTEPVPAITAVPGMLYSLGTIPGQAMYWGYVKAGGLSLRWFRDQVLGRHGDDDAYKEYDRLAAAVAPGSDGVLFTPYLSGGGPDNPNAAGTWIGMTMATDLGTLWRSMLESIAYEYASFLEVFSAHGNEVQEVIAIGGGASSPLWNQIKADVNGVPWRTPSRQDGAILANAALAAQSIGAIDDLAATIDSWVVGADEFSPRPDAAARYDQIRAVRSELAATSLRQLYAQIAPLRQMTE